MKLFLAFVISLLTLAALFVVTTTEARHHFSPQVMQGIINRHNKFKQSYKHNLQHNNQVLKPGAYNEKVTSTHHQQQKEDSFYKPVRNMAAPVEGAWFGANQNFFGIANPLINDLLSYELTNFTYPEYNTSELGIHIYLNNVTVTSFTCNDCLSIALGNNYMNMRFNQFSMNLNLAYVAKALFLKSSGTCTPEIDNMNLTAEISFAPPFKGRPQIKVSNINLEVNELTLNCDGFAGHIANALTDVFKFFLSDLMDDVLNLVVTHEVNEYLANATLSYNIDDYAMINFDLVPAASSITNRDLSVGVQGIVTPISNPNIVFPFPPPANLKAQCIGGGMVNIGLSTFSFQTFLYTYFIGNQLRTTFPSLIKASDLKIFIPGFAKTLGDAALLNVSFAAENYGSIQTVPSQNQLSLSVTLNITLDGAQNTKYEMQAFADVAIDISAMTVNNAAALKIYISTLSLSNPQVIYTNVGGELGGPLAITFLNGVVKSVVLKEINKYLGTKGLPLPAVSGFVAQNPKIIINDDSICVASNIAPAPQP